MGSQRTVSDFLPSRSPPARGIHRAGAGHADNITRGVTHPCAMASLERINTPASRAVIQLLAKGSPDAITTREAKSTSDRLTRITRLSTFHEKQTKGHSDLESGISD